ncbi:hypothetical protein [Deinococcus saxicola]|uniref:hypothetical protein n=1 Tax=Deinococcus saxicola TaxID=249406 RepID=UPI0039EE0E5E
MTYADLRQEVTAVRDSDQAFVEAFTTYLNLDTEDRLSDLHALWREARYTEIDREVQRLRQPARWDWLMTSQQIDVLTIAWQLEVQLQRDAVRAEKLLSEIETLGGDTLPLRVASVDGAAELATLVERLRGRTDALAVHARVFLQLEQNHFVDRELDHLIAQGEATAETYRLFALAHLSRGELPAARRKIDLALSMPTANEMTRLSGAIITVQEARPSVLWQHGLPQPVPQVQTLACQDDASGQKLGEAAELFAQAVQVRLAAGGQASHWQAWQLACLADSPVRRGEAAALAQRMLEGNPGDPLPWLWTVYRELEVDIQAHLEAVEKLIQEPVSDPLQFAYALALSAAGEAARAEAVQQTLPAPVAGVGGINAADALLVLRLPLGVRHPLAGAQAFMELALSGRWTDAAPHARWFTAQVQTFGALLMASTTTFNAADFATCRDLLTAPDAVLWCPGGSLPIELQEQLAEAYARTGNLPLAADLAEHLLHDASDERRVTLYARLLAGLGDDARLQVIARKAVTSPGLPPGLLLALSDEISDQDQTLARQLWHCGDELGYPDELLGLALSAALTLGLIEEATPLLNRAWMAGSARTGMVMGTDSPPREELSQNGGPGLLEVQLTQMVEDQQRALGQANQAYLSASTPLAFAFAGQPIAALLAETLTGSVQRLALLGRHGGRPLPTHDPSVTRLNLDLSGFIVAASFDLLDTLQAEFGPLRITPYLMLSLTQGMHACRPNPEEGIWRVIQDEVRAGRLHVLPADAPQTSALKHLGDGWEVAAPYLTQADHKVVDDLAVRQHRLGAIPDPEFPVDAVLPKDVLTALVKAGAVDAAQAEEAEPFLWSPHSTCARPVAGDTLFLTGAALFILARVGLLQATSQLFTLVIAYQTAQSNTEKLERAHQTRQTREQLRIWRERLRSELHSGRFVVLSHPGQWTAARPSMPAADLEMILASHFEPHDALWIEDRAISAQPRLQRAQTWTLTDVLTTLHARRRLPAAQSRRLVRRQREVGMGLTPTTPAELSALLEEAPSTAPQATPDLRAWASHVQAVRHFAPALQDSEGLYVQQVVHASLQAMLSLWKDPVSPNTCKKAMWLVEHAPLSVTNVLQVRTGASTRQVKAVDGAHVVQLTSRVTSDLARTAFIAWWTETYFTGNEASVAESLCTLLLSQLGQVRPGFRQEWLQLKIRKLPEPLQAGVTDIWNSRTQDDALMLETVAPDTGQQS